MKRRMLLAATLCSTLAEAATMPPNTLTPAEQAEGWQLLFDGQSLEHWRASDAPGSFSVQGGAIVVKGPRSHLFYLGPVAQHAFRNFELKVDLLTHPGANSGVYFHTQWQAVGWPAQGYEVQVNNSHSDPSRSGALWGVVDYPAVTVPDGQWQTLSIRVEGQRVVTRIDGQLIVDYTQEPAPARRKGLEARLLGSGTFCLQGHDPDSEVHFRNIKVRLLP
jgi:hypothetical protein